MRPSKIWTTVGAQLLKIGAETERPSRPHHAFSLCTFVDHF